MSLTTEMLYLGGGVVTLALVTRGWIDYRRGRGIIYALKLTAASIGAVALGLLIFPHLPHARQWPSIGVQSAVYAAAIILIGGAALFQWRRTHDKESVSGIVSWGILAFFALQLGWQYLPLPR
jgi:hypothetical protein